MTNAALSQARQRRIDHYIGTFCGALETSFGFSGLGVGEKETVHSDNFLKEFYFKKKKKKR